MQYQGLRGLSSAFLGRTTLDESPAMLMSPARVEATHPSALGGGRTGASVGAILVPGLLAMLAAIPAAFMIRFVNDAFPGQSERILFDLGGFFVVFVAVPCCAYVVVRRRRVDPGVLGLIALAAVCVSLVSVYLYWVSFYVRFPADILTWSESDFVNDILKFRVGYPLYTAQQNNESFTYPPATQVLTYFLAWLSGNALSIPTYRAIQVGYTLLASIVAVMCCRQLVALALPSRPLRHASWWGALWLPFLFLIATNSLTNPFVHNLHDDALAQLISVVAYWLLLEYTATRSTFVLAMMAIIPALGFLVKQSLAVWVVFYCVQLAVFTRPRSVKHLVLFALPSLGCVVVVVGVGYFLWGNDWFYWVFLVLGKHDVSPLRSIQHVFDVWIYYVLGLLGGLILLRGKSLTTLVGPWLLWLAFILVETWSSGIAWMLNHIGPGTLIAGIWFLAGLCRLWSAAIRAPSVQFRPRVWLEAGLGVAVVALLFNGIGVIRVPLRPFDDAPYAYIRAIDSQFEGQSPSTILLDFGTWVYLQDGVVMKDRAPSIGERGYSETGDFSGMIRRLGEKRYSKILVRELHAPDFWYDYGTWRRSSGIRAALLANYHEVGTIPAVVENSPGWLSSYGFGEVSILVPNSN